jgi:hypothetical protein
MPLWLLIRSSLRRRHPCLLSISSQPSTNLSEIRFVRWFNQWLIKLAATLRNKMNRFTEEIWGRVQTLIPFVKAERLVPLFLDLGLIYFIVILHAHDILFYGEAK